VGFEEMRWPESNRVIQWRPRRDE
ncbi:Acetyl-CoA carboxylase, carboxyltransferase component-like protein, partial [Lacticaseibacillus paracasei subsp. paracasei Lpp126]